MFKIKKKKNNYLKKGFVIFTKEPKGKNPLKKGFTLVEFVIVMAIIGILVLMASPKFMKYVNKAKITHIINDVKVAEDFYNTEDIENLYRGGNKKILSDKEVSLTGINKEGKSIKFKGYLIVDAKSNINSKLDGDFYYSPEAEEVYYYEERIGEDFDEEDIDKPEGEEKPTSPTTPDVIESLAIKNTLNKVFENYWETDVVVNEEDIEKIDKDKEGLIYLKNNTIFTNKTNDIQAIDFNCSELEIKNHIINNSKIKTTTTETNIDPKYFKNVEIKLDKKNKTMEQTIILEIPYQELSNSRFTYLFYYPKSFNFGEIKSAGNVPIGHDYSSRFTQSKTLEKADQLDFNIAYNIENKSYKGKVSDIDIYTKHRYPPNLFNIELNKVDSHSSKNNYINIVSAKVIQNGKENIVNPSDINGDIRNQKINNSFNMIDGFLYNLTIKGFDLSGDNIKVEVINNTKNTKHVYDKSGVNRYKVNRRESYDKTITATGDSEEYSINIYIN